MKYMIFFLFITWICIPADAQKYKTNSGTISFFSEAPLENIEAENKNVFCAYDSATGGIYFQVPMKKFEFEKSLMQKHFNENYLETDKYPYGKFSGQVINHDEINHSKQGSCQAVVQGELTIHGVTKAVKETGTFQINKDGITGKAKFKIRLKDYHIKIPRAVIKNIAEEVEVTVNITMNPIKDNS